MVRFPFAFRRSSKVFLFVVVTLSLFFSSCARPQYPAGEWVSSLKVAGAFEQAWVFRDHTYYYVGSIAKPDGVIAIDNRYRLRDNNVWARVDVDESTLREWQHWWRADTSARVAARPVIGIHLFAATSCRCRKRACSLSIGHAQPPVQPTVKAATATVWSFSG